MAEPSPDSTRFHRYKQRLMDHPAVAVVLLSAIALIGLGQVTGTLGKMWMSAKRQFQASGTPALTSPNDSDALAEEIQFSYARDPYAVTIRVPQSILADATPTYAIDHCIETDRGVDCINWDNVTISDARTAVAQIAGQLDIIIDGDTVVVTLSYGPSLALSEDFVKVYRVD